MELELSGRVATWLELAVAPEWRKQQSKVRLHAVGDEAGGCFALSMDGRWLCASGGQLTVFKGLGAALQFLKSVKVDDFEPGEMLAADVDCCGRSYCLGLDRDNHLTVCRGCRKPQRLDA